MPSYIMSLPTIKKASKRAFDVMSRKAGMPPSERQGLALAKLERAGFKIGPGVDLKMK